MSEVTKSEVDKMKQNLNALAFMHQKMLTTAFFPEEFEVVKQSLELVATLAKELDAKIIEADPEIKARVEAAKAKEEIKEVTPEVVEA